MCVLCEERSGRGAPGYVCASMGASWTSSWAKRELKERWEAVRWEALNKGGKSKLVVTEKTPFAGWGHEIFEMGEKKRRFREAVRESKQIGLRKVRNVNKEKKVCTGWYGMHCVQDSYAE